MALKRTLVTLAIVAVAILGWRFVVSPLWLMLSEGAVPSVADLRVPGGTTVLGTERFCGSGMCWIEVILEPAEGQSDAELVRELGVSAEETCEPGAPPMFWTTCRSVGGSFPARGVEISLYYQR